MEDIIILIPAYKPNKATMIGFLNDLMKKFKRIVVVDDGSGNEYEDFFKEIESTGIPVLSYDTNKGKGRSNKDRN